MSIIIHVSKPSEGKGEVDEDIDEESVVEGSVNKFTKSCVNKPISFEKNSNDLNRIDRIRKYLKPKKSYTIEEKIREEKDFIKTIKKCETDSYSMNEAKIDVSE